MRTEPIDARWRVVLLSTVLVAAVLRFAGLQSGLWYDEIVTLVTSARHPISRIVTDYPALNLHPLYSVLAHASIATFGESAWSLRLPACLFGIASVVMAYALGTKLVGTLEAWAGAAVLAASYHHVWFSQNARGYTLMGFLTLVTTWLLLRAWEGDRPRDYVLYALASAAGIYTHLTMTFVVIGHALVLIGALITGWVPARASSLRRAAWAFAAAALLSIALYAPFLSAVFANMTADAPRKAAQVATASWALGEAVRSLLSGAGVPAAIAGGLFAAIGALSLWRRHAFAVALFLVPAIVTAVAIILLRQPLRPRFFFFLSGAAAIFVGRGIGAFVEAAVSRSLVPRRSSVGALVVCTLVLVSASALALPQNYRVPKQDFDGAVQFLSGEEARGSEIAASGPACWPLTFYYQKPWRCLTTIDDWHAIDADARRVLIAYTLAEYIEDPELRLHVRSDCPIVQRFPGTLGQGDILVCEATRERR